MVSSNSEAIGLGWPSGGRGHRVAYTHVVLKGPPLLVETSATAEQVGGEHWGTFGLADALDQFSLLG